MGKFYGFVIFILGVGLGISSITLMDYMESINENLVWVPLIVAVIMVIAGLVISTRQNPYPAYSR